MSRSRVLETRLNEMRPTYNMNFVSPLEVPFEPDPDMNYIWASIGGNSHRVDKLLRMGAEYVERIKTDKVFINPLSKNPHADKFYFYSDTVLMKIPKATVEQIDAQQNIQNANKIKSLPAVMRPGDKPRCINM